MNKYQYGLDYLVGTSYMTYSCDKNELTHHKAQIDLQELVERATKKKPYLQDEEDDILLCPSCNEELDNQKYCHRCGQALDWSE